MYEFWDICKKFGACPGLGRDNYNKRITCSWFLKHCWCTILTKHCCVGSSSPGDGSPFVHVVILLCPNVRTVSSGSGERNTQTIAQYTHLPDHLSCSGWGEYSRASAWVPALGQGVYGLSVLRSAYLGEKAHGAGHTAHACVHSSTR
jgi:hypothetical protein